MAKLEVKNLRISFRTNNGAVRAVRDVSFNLKEGETLAIVGESGSGKSVTARAIMGILAGNAMVDNGEIIYDGQDLLKISEDDFHTLRGHRLAMIFQDPLSALNPIMRIGKQLTEAMILNNKERRKDGKRRYDRMISLLEKNIVAAYQEEGSDRRDITRQKIATFKRFIDRGVKLQSEYSNAHESLLEANDYVDEVKLELRRNSERTVREALSRLVKAAGAGYHPYLIKQGTAGYAQLITGLTHHARHFHLRDTNEVNGQLDQLRLQIEDALELVEPSFFAIAYQLEHGMSDLPSGDLADINQKSGFCHEYRLHE